MAELIEIAKTYIFMEDNVAAEVVVFTDCRVWIKGTSISGIVVQDANSLTHEEREAIFTEFELLKQPKKKKVITDERPPILI